MTRGISAMKLYPVKDMTCTECGSDEIQVTVGRDRPDENLEVQNAYCTACGNWDTAEWTRAHQPRRAR